MAILFCGALLILKKPKRVLRLLLPNFPYQVNKAELIIKMADLVKNKIIEGISNIRDESDKRGIVLLLSLNEAKCLKLYLNQLYKHTSLQTTVGILMLALLDNKPLVFTLRQLIREFLMHREVVVTKRCQFELAKAQAREHILLGFIIALSHIDEVVALIKTSASAEEAITKLHDRFGLTTEQSKAILDMRLQRLTGLEQEKIYQELEDIKITIANLKAILADASFA